MDYSKLKKIASENNYTLDRLAIEIGMSVSGFHAAIRNNTLRVDNLEKAAELLKIDIVSFFNQTEKTIHTNCYNCEKYKIENEHLKLQLKDKEKIIYLLENEVKQLKNK